MTGPSIPPAPAPLTADLWNVLHDGWVAGVAGAVPGEVRLTVACEYLREQFPGPGDRFEVTLHDCAALSFEPYGGTSVAGPAAVAAAGPDFGSAETPNEVLGGNGVLRVEAAGYSLALDGGRPIALDDLKAAAAAYRAGWGAETGSGPPPGPRPARSGDGRRVPPAPRSP